MEMIVVIVFSLMITVIVGVWCYEWGFQNGKSSVLPRKNTAKAGQFRPD